jgi:hypothetical protein
MGWALVFIRLFFMALGAFLLVFNLSYLYRRDGFLSSFSFEVLMVGMGLFLTTFRPISLELSCLYLGTNYCLGQSAKNHYTFLFIF